MSETAVKPGYQVTELGVIPEDWAIVRIKDICSSIIDCVNKTAPSVEYSTPYRMIRTTNVRNCKVDTSEVRFVEKSIYEEWIRRGTPENGDIIFTREAPVGESGILTDSEGIFLGQRLMMYRVNESLALNNFILYSLNSFYCKTQINDFSSGATVAHMRVPECGELKIILPPLPEQKAIAAALSDVDALITAQEALIAKKRDIKTATMQQLLTGKVRLGAFVQQAGASRGESEDGVPPGYQQTELGVIPEDWEIISFNKLADPKDSFSIIGGPFGSNLKSSDYTDSGVRIIQLQNIGDGYFVNDVEVFTSTHKANELLSCNIYPGDILLSKMGDPVARACIVPDFHDRYLMCSDGIRLKVNGSKFSTEFIYFQLNSKLFRSQAINASTGSTRQRIGLSDLKKLKLIQPPLPEQNAIAEVLSDMDAEITALEAQRDKTRAIKQGMMQELLTGKTRLL